MRAGVAGRLIVLVLALVGITAASLELAKSPSQPAPVVSTAAPPQTTTTMQPPVTTTDLLPPPSVRTPAKVQPLVYTVKPGDTLTDIATWFSFHGYQALFEANKAALGPDPNLIYPGEKITLSAAGMTVNP